MKACGSVRERLRLEPRPCVHATGDDDERRASGEEASSFLHVALSGTLLIGETAKGLLLDRVPIRIVKLDGLPWKRQLGERSRVPATMGP